MKNYLKYLSKKNTYRLLFFSITFSSMALLISYFHSFYKINGYLYINTYGEKKPLGGEIIKILEGYGSDLSGNDGNFSIDVPINLDPGSEITFGVNNENLWIINPFGGIYIIRNKKKSVNIDTKSYKNSSNYINENFDEVSNIFLLNSNSAPHLGEGQELSKYQLLKLSEKIARGNNSSAVNIYNSIIQSTEEKSKDDSTKTLANSDILSNSLDSKIALTYYEESADLTRELFFSMGGSNKKPVYNAYLKLSNLYYNMQKYLQAIEIYNEMISHWVDTDIDKNLSLFYLANAQYSYYSIYGNNALLEKAKENYQLALSFFIKNKQVRPYIDVKIKINLANLDGNKKNSLEILESLNNHTLKKGNEPLWLTVRNNIFAFKLDSYQNTCNLSKIDQLIMEMNALDKEYSNENPTFFIDISFNLANAFFIKGDCSSFNKIEASQNIYLKGISTLEKILTNNLNNSFFNEADTINIKMKIASAFRRGADLHEGQNAKALLNKSIQKLKEILREVPSSKYIIERADINYHLAYSIFKLSDYFEDSEKKTLLRESNYFLSKAIKVYKTDDLEFYYSALNLRGYNLINIADLEASSETKNSLYRKAAADIEIAVTGEPENPAYLDSLGWLKYRMKDFSLAENILEKALSLTKKRKEKLEIYSHLIEVYLRNKKYKEAEKIFKLLKAEHPNSVEVKKANSLLKKSRQ